MMWTFLWLEKQFSAVKQYIDMGNIDPYIQYINMDIGYWRIFNIDIEYWNYVWCQYMAIYWFTLIIIYILIYIYILQCHFLANSLYIKSIYIIIYLRVLQFYHSGRFSRFNNNNNKMNKSGTDNILI
jgi:hypothetical protein